MLEGNREYRIGEFSLTPDRNLMDGPGGKVHLEPKVMAVLRELVDQGGEPVSREHLMATVWAGTVVGDEALTRCISELRAAFADDAQQPRYIRTIPKMGYQLVMPVTQPKASKTWWLSAVAAALVLALSVWLLWPAVDMDLEPPSVAILPFDALTDDVATDHFGAGLAEQILHALVNVDGLRVASRYASFQVDETLPVAEIAQLLKVDHVLFGSVRRMADTVRVSVQLVDVRTGFHVWSNTFDGDIAGLLDIQDEIASAVARALEVELHAPVSVARITQDIDALDLYLLGRHHWHKRTPASLERAIGFFQQALAIDPESARAHSGLADAQMLLASYGDLTDLEAANLAAPSVEAALAIDPNLGHSQASLGMLMHLRGDNSSAERAYRRATDLDPHNEMAQMWLANQLGARGALMEAHQAYSQAYVLAPTHPTIVQNFLNSLMSIGDYAGANEVLDQYSASEPNAMIEELKGTFALDTGRSELAQQTAEILDKLGRREAAAMIRWQLSLKHGDWTAATHWLSTVEPDANASSDDVDPKVYLARLEHEALRGDPELRIDKLVASASTWVNEKLDVPLMVWRGVSHAQRGEHADAVELLQQAHVLIADYGHGYVPFQLMVLSYLANSCEQLDDIACLSRATQDGSAIITASRARGWASVPFLIQATLFHAVVGDQDAAIASQQQAMAQADLNPTTFTLDPHTQLLSGNPILDVLVSRMNGPIEST